MGSGANQIALIAPAVRAADPRLPPYLQWPDATGAMARLTYINREEDDKGRGGPVWKLEGSPAVIMLAYRLLGSIWQADGSSAKNSFTFPASLGAFEDLMLLMHRYPVEIRPTAREVFNDFYDQTVKSWLMANAADLIVPPSPDSHFKGTLRSYQEDGVRFMQANRRSMLADDMGLGKTVQAFAVMDRMDEWPAVIVAQPHMVTHWEKKTPLFMVAERAGVLAPQGALTFATLKGTRPDRTAPHKADIFILNYAVLSVWVNWLIARGVRTVILDECQEARHPGTQKHDALRRLCRSARNVWGLSGTPIYNRGPEIYNVMHTINRGSLGARKDFEAVWCDYDAMGKLIVKEPAALNQYLIDRRLMLRRRKTEVAKEIPPKHRVIEDITGDESKFNDLVREAVKLAREALHVANPFDRARMEAEAISQTRKATGIAKTPSVIAFLRALMEAGEPTLVFAHHHAVHDAICDALEEFSPVRITGEETKAVKAANQERFERGESNLCVIALRAASGLDGLQARARVVVFAELDWSPAVHKQGEDRAHRIGQTGSVLIYYLVANLGSDPMVMATLDVKESQFLGLMNDAAEDDAMRKVSDAAANQHKEQVLQMLRGRR